MASRATTAFLDDLGTLSRCLRSLAAEAYAEHGIGSTQAKFLRHIGAHPRLSQADLARATQTDPGLTGRALETLVERGWVRRTRSTEDARQYVLDLSASGKRACDRVEREREAIAARVVAALDGRDLEDFERIVRKVVSAVDSLRTRESDPAT
jgi:DNA-binding MarR family transcriptional regulator